MVQHIMHVMNIYTHTQATHGYQKQKRYEYIHTYSSYPWLSETKAPTVKCVFMIAY